VTVCGIATQGFANKEKFEAQPSAGKIMYSSFWDKRGVILVDFVE
jgi:hypothetical protein